jgi:8-oxo-dGTP diphosphatase
MQRRTPAKRLVVTGLLRQRGGALMVHRSPNRQWYPDAWDLPGGHVIDGEVPRAALARELQEELGITVDVVGEPFAHVQGADFRMDV